MKEPYLFTDGKHPIYVIFATSRKKALEYRDARRFSGTCAGIDTRTPEEQWNSQVLAYTDDQPIFKG